MGQDRWETGGGSGLLPRTKPGERPAPPLGRDTLGQRSSLNTVASLSAQGLWRPLALTSKTQPPLHQPHCSLSPKPGLCIWGGSQRHHVHMGSAASQGSEGLSTWSCPQRDTKRPPSSLLMQTCPHTEPGALHLTPGLHATWEALTPPGPPTNNPRGMRPVHGGSAPQEPWKPVRLSSTKEQPHEPAPRRKATRPAPVRSLL